MISQQEAKQIMDTETGYVILDVREISEYATGHIPNAKNIPLSEIPHRAQTELPDKGQKILVYCRSGARSKMAEAVLQKMGYTNIKEFGGILNWPYEIVTD